MLPPPRRFSPSQHMFLTSNLPPPPQRLRRQFLPCLVLRLITRPPSRPTTSNLPPPQRLRRQFLPCLALRLITRPLFPAYYVKPTTTTTEPVPTVSGVEADNTSTTPAYYVKPSPPFLPQGRALPLWARQFLGAMRPQPLRGNTHHDASTGDYHFRGTSRDHHF
ncbi:hypothetical protein BC829DRAFT_105128 [Chytridium lagenaria]|nr:hypothetical protein BC829DRAFT_105128 [Chytridium lagenaria]